jgi:histidine ammonia-lyase
MRSWTTDKDWVSIEDLVSALNSDVKIEFGPTSRQRVLACADYLAGYLAKDAPLVYGVNTGFGSLCNIPIPKEEMGQLQVNLLRSHACGTGDMVPKEVVRMILLLKVLSLSKGYSGVQMATIERLAHMLNEDILPVIYTLGSLGASGDLAPLAHMALPLIGEGEVHVKDTISKVSDLSWEALALGPKEGLALINGTQFSTAYAAYALIESRRLLDLAIKIAALSMDVFGCRRTPLDPRIHNIRRQAGQIEVAQRLLDFLQDSPLESISGSSVQDPYSFRCLPQVLGATLDTLDHAQSIIEREVNAVTDNPNVFYEDGVTLEGGNFHAQPIALINDYLAIAMSEVASISERRIFLLVSGYRDLPVYLTPNPGMESGMMIVQYTAASVVSQNKQLCTPASVDTIPSSKGQEDHVSMAANAGTKLYQVIKNVERVLAMELLVAMQALDCRRPMKSSQTIEDFYEAYRKVVPPLEKDRIFAQDIEASIAFLRNQ